MTTEEPTTIVQAAGKSLPFLIDLGTAWLVLPAYPGEIYPPQISDGIDNRASDSFVGFTCLLRSLHVQKSGLRPHFSRATTRSRHSLPCCLTAERDKLTEQISVSPFTIPLFKGTHLTMTVTSHLCVLVKDGAGNRCKGYGRPELVRIYGSVLGSKEVLEVM